MRLFRKDNSVKLLIRIMINTVKESTVAGQDKFTDNNDQVQ